MERVSETRKSERESERRRLSLDALQQVAQIAIEVQPVGESQPAPTYPEVPHGATVRCCARAGCLYGCVWDGKDPRACLPIFLNVSSTGEPDNRLGAGTNLPALLPCCFPPQNAEMVRAPRDVKELLARYHKGESKGLGIEAFRRKETEKERISGRMKL